MLDYQLDCKLNWSVYTCLTQLYDGRDMYIIYYIKNNYVFRPFSLAIFRLIVVVNLTVGHGMTFILSGTNFT